MSPRLARTALLAPLAAALVAGLAPVASAQSPSPLHVSFGGDGRYPARSLVVRAPANRPLTASTVQITENGGPVSNVSVDSVSKAAAGDFGVVLVIDTNTSMAGAPLQGAMAAARTLAAQRTGLQELGVITFNQSARVALPLTDNPGAIQAALASTPKTGRGALIYDAMDLALKQLRSANIAAGAVILLSDGASQGAKPHPGFQPTLTTITTAAGAAHARIFTIGLRDSAYSPQRMSVLAHAGGGQFIPANSAQLGGIFNRIESLLTSQYVVRYRSLQPLGRQIQVRVSVNGVPGSWTRSYASPAPAPQALKPARPRPHGPPHKPFWLSTLALVLVACASAFLLAVGLVAFLLPRLRQHDLRRRVAQFTAAGTAPTIDPLPAPERPERRNWLDRAFEGTAWWANFKERIEIARIERSPGQLIALTALGTAVFAVAFSFAAGTPVVCLFVVPLGPVALLSLVGGRLARQRRLFADQLPSHLQELAAAMRVGHSLVGGLQTITDSAAEPTRAEFQRVLADERLGEPLDEALQPVARRMACDDVQQVALVASLHQRTGGNMAAVIDQVADGVRERGELRRELQALTAQARLSRWIVTLLPPTVLGIVALLDRPYIKPLFNTTTGVILLAVATGMVIAGSVVMKMIVKVEV